MKLLFVTIICMVSIITVQSEETEFEVEFAVRPAPPALDASIVDLINTNKSIPWEAVLNPYFHGKSLDDVKRLCGIQSIEYSTAIAEAPIMSASYGAVELPESFDAREEWGDVCESLFDIRDQAGCGGCWAVAAANAITDRICIHSNGTRTPYISAADILSCCGYQCGSCSGGQPEAAWKYWVQEGVVTGGSYESKAGCWPYPWRMCGHGPDSKLKSCGGEGAQKTPVCKKKCNNRIDWNKDKQFGSSFYRIPASVSAIQQELITNGPLEATFYVYEDFIHYKSGVYVHTTGSMLGGHAVKLIGWGVDKKTGVKYWTLANSWNTDWGDNGYFKIRRGTNEVKIEELLYAGKPKLPLRANASK
jgi:cathepsin B